MIDLQIRILYCTYKWSIQEIAKLLEIPRSAVLQSISTQDLIQSEENLPSPPMVSATNAPVPATLLPQEGMDASDEHFSNNTISALMDVETSKQREIAPIISVIEILLLDKVMRAAKALDPEDVREMGDIVTTFKKLTQDAIINNVVKVTKDDSKNTNVNQIVIQRLSFREQ